MSFTSWLGRLTTSVQRSRRVATKRPPFHIQPMLEALENRTLPSTAPFAATYVATLYQGFLHRNPSSSDLTYWTNQMSNGATTTNVAQQILTSPEAFSGDIQADYTTLLGRSVDSAGLQFWQNALQNGASLQQVKGGIAGSAEFFQKAGGTNDAYVKALYQVVLGRSADPSGETYFDNLLQQGNTPQQVADQITSSPEAANDDVNQDYQQVLAHPADTVGLNYWQPLLAASPVGQAVVAAGIAGSQEYSTAITDALPSINTTDPIQAAQTFVTDNGLYAAATNSSSTTTTTGAGTTTTGGSTGNGGNGSTGSGDFDSYVIISNVKGTYTGTIDENTNIPSLGNPHLRATLTIAITDMTDTGDHVHFNVSGTATTGAVTFTGLPPDQFDGGVYTVPGTPATPFTGTYQLTAAPTTFTPQSGTLTLPSTNSQNGGQALITKADTSAPTTMTFSYTIPLDVGSATVQVALTKTD